MAPIRTGNTPKTRMGGTLTLRHPLFSSALENGDFDNSHIAEACRFGNAILRDKLAFNEKPGRGLFGSRRLSRVAAELAWQRAFGKGGAA